MPSTSAWQKVNKVLCCPWLALLLSCQRTGPVHQEISMLRPSRVLLSYWHGRNLSTMQTKSLPTPSITWRLKVSPGGRTIHSYVLRLWEMKMWIDAKKSVNDNKLFRSVVYDQHSLVKAICCCCTEQRLRRSQKGNFTGIKTGLASVLSPP